MTPPFSIHFLTVFLMAFAATFLTGAALITFGAAFFAGVFFTGDVFTAFFAGAFLAAFLADASWAAFFATAFLAGAVFIASPTAVTALLTADLTASATFDAKPSPVPTATLLSENRFLCHFQPPQFFC
jgi:hypothetical protein